MPGNLLRRRDRLAADAEDRRQAPEPRTGRTQVGDHAAPRDDGDCFVHHGLPRRGAGRPERDTRPGGGVLQARPEEHNVQLHLLTPEPGTGLTQRFGDSLDYDGHITDFTFPTLENDDASVMQSHPDIFMNHHYYPTVLPRQRHVFVTSIYQALQSFGYVALAHLIRFAGGRLSL